MAPFNFLLINLKNSSSILLYNISSIEQVVSEPKYILQNSASCINTLYVGIVELIVDVVVLPSFHENVITKKITF